MKTSKKNQGQSTVELALLLPILFGLVYWIIKAYHANADNADRAMQEHAQALINFNHGNSGDVVVNGLTVLPGRVEEIGSPDFHNPIGGLASSFLSLGISNLFSHLFGDNTNVVMGFAKGSAQNMAEQEISSGFKTDQMNWQAVRDAGWVGSLTSDQANEFFKGDGDTSGFSAQDFFGSGLQGGLVAYSQGGFQDERKFLGGAIGGLMNSESSKNWFNSGNEILKGAAKGALASAASGLITGKVELSNVATQAALGAFYTEKVARMFPWAGSENARSATAFSATNAAVSMLLHQGGRATGKELLLTAAAGGLLSGQTQRVIRGNQTGILPTIESTAVTLGGVSALGSLANGNSEAIGRSVYYATVSSGGGFGSSPSVLAARNSLGSSNTPSEINSAMEKAATVEAFSQMIAQGMALP